MAKSALELAVETGKWDAGLKKAKSALDSFTDSQGGLQQALAKDSDKIQKFVKMIGQTVSTAKTAKGQMNDYKASIEQLTMQYNRMTDAQKKSIGQDYLNAIEQLKQKYQSVNEEIQAMNRSLNQTANINKQVVDTKTASPFDSIASKFTKANLYAYGVEKGVEALTSMIEHTKQLIDESSRLAREAEGIQQAYDRLNRPDLLDKLRQATHGTVSDLELMKQAVKFKDFNLDIDSMGSMLAFAQQKAKDTGESIDYMVSSITTGLGRKSLMILDNLGLSAADIKDRMEETGDMTIAVADIINDRMKDVGDYYQTTSDRIAASNAIIENSMLKLGNQVQSTMGMTTDEIYNAFEIGFIATLTDTVKGIGVVIGKIEDMGKAIGITEQTIKSMGVSMDEINKPFSENPPFVKMLKAIGETAKFIISPLAAIADLQDKIAGSEGEDPNEKRAQNTAHNIIGSINRTSDKTGEYSKSISSACSRW